MSGSLNWDLLVCPTEARGRERPAQQYWVACWTPSDRYVMSVPSSA